MMPTTPPGRPLDDPAAVRSAVFDNALTAFQAIPPATNQLHTLSIQNPQYAGPETFSAADHKRAILTGGTLARKLRGDIVLTDNGTGQPVAARTMTLANVPYYTNDGTFVYRGSDWTLANQLRLKPGVYTREKDNGDLEAHVNVLPGQGVSHRLYMDPKSGVFRASINQAQIPLVPMLRALGANDAQIKAAWGPELAAVNFAKTGGGDLKKLYDRLVRDGTETDPVKQSAAIREALEKTQLNPKVNARTLKKEFANVNADMVLAATRKLLAVRNRNDKDYLAKLGLDPDEQDDRDHLAYMRLFGPEDMIAERIRAGAGALNQVLWKAGRTKTLDGLTAGLFDKPIMSAILSSGLGQPSESVNPTQIFEQMLRVSRMGYGGIPSPDSIPDSSRSVQPSHLNYIDPSVTPESGNAGVDVRFAAHVRKGKDGELYAPFVDKTGAQVWHQPDELFDSVIGFSKDPKNAYDADGTPFVDVMHRGKQTQRPMSEVDLWLPSMESAFTASANLLAGKSGEKGNRVSMGARMTNQALSLEGGEAPLVESVDQSGTPYGQIYGARAGAVRAKSGGRVNAVRPDGIDVTYADGTRDTIELAQYKPNNRKTYFHQEPVVQVGQSFGPNTLLATSNYVDKNGSISLGKNLRVGYLPMEGKNFEDAIALSQSAADKLASQHMYQTPVDYGDFKPSKARYMGSFGKRFKREQLDMLDERGVIKPGTKVEYGDPIVLNMRQRTARSGDVSKARARAFTDTSEIWEHHKPGFVQDVVETKGGVNVSVRTTVGLQETDKVSGRYGNKGIVSVVPDDEMPVGEDGKPLEVLLNPLGIISRANPIQAVEAVLGKIAAKTGQPYSLPDFDKTKIENLIDFARQESAKHGVSDTETLTDPKTGRKIPNVLTGMSYLMKLHHVAECYDDQTEVLTHRGWTPWPEARDDDRFASMEDEKLVYLPASTVTRAPYTGPLNTFTGRYVEYAVTPNHRMWIQGYNWQQDWGFRTAEELHGVRFLVRQSGFQPDAGAPMVARIGDKEIDWDDYCELVGWWASEGYAKPGAGQAGFVTIYQSASANPEYVRDIEELIRRLPWRWSYFRVAGQIMGITILDGALSRHLHAHGTHSQNKRLPREVLDGPLSGRQRLFSSMMRGDGNKQELPGGKSWRYSTTSKQLADDFQELLLRIGMGGTVRACKPRKETHYLPAWNVGITIQRSRAQVDGDRNKTAFQVRQYDGLVYCATVRTGLLIVRRNGKPLLCGNSKEAARAFGSYTADHAPAKGGAEGSKTWGMLALNAMLSAGATHVARDASLVRGQYNPDYWAAVMQGRTPPDPEVPFVYKKMVNQMQAAGINPVRDGTRTHVMALTQKDINRLAENREVTSPDTVDWNDEGLTPVKGGLFDETVFGGSTTGARWGKITLAEPMLNPVMQEPAQRLLGLTEKKLRDVIAGREKLGSATGPAAIKAALENLNVDHEIEQTKLAIRGGKRTARDQAVRKLGYLLGSQKTGVHPGEWVWDAVPVLPPVFRPISKMQESGTPIVSDANYLYRDLFANNENLKALSKQVEDVGDERLAVYDSVRAVTGLADPANPKLKEQKVRGVLKQLLGDSPKHSLLQRKILGSTTDLVGRATIRPNADLDMDQIGIPEESAWKVYQPWIVRHLVKRGMSAARAAGAVATRDTLAATALNEVMQSRPVIADRAPTLHRFGVMAFWPKLVKGHSIELSPVTTKGFGADFDGDAMQFHVPSTDKAVEDAIRKQLPSANLLAPSDFKAHLMPSQEFLAGLYAASTARNDERPVVFASAEDAIKAFRRGELDVGSPIEIIKD